MDELLQNLKERQKELNCIHELEDILIDFESPLEIIFYKILRVLPNGWQFPDKCFAEIEYEGNSYKVANFENTKYVQKLPLHKNNITFGEIRIYYTDVPPELHNEPFLKEEYSLLKTIAGILSSYLVVRFYKDKNLQNIPYKEWKVIIKMLQNTDIKLYLRVARKLLNLLFQKGISEAKSIYSNFGANSRHPELEITSEINAPLKKKDYRETMNLSAQIFQIAEKNFSDEELMDFIGKWIQEDKLNFLTISLESPDSTLSVIQDALFRYQNQNLQKDCFSPFAYMNVKVLLIQKLFTNQLEFINVAKNYVELEDFYDVLQHTIFPANSHGKLGGKSTGIFFASNIIRQEAGDEFCQNIKTPRTWYITSDAMLNFLHYNNLEEIVEQKYKDIEIVRAEYGNIIQMFKNSHFPLEISKGLSQLLDTLGNQPIIVRSSSLLEDSFGAAFSGKYKSLFLANQGSKAERLTALKDAIAEVYASIVGPDPIEYRKERGLLDFKEEMAILIQEVVGEKCGKYFFPAFAGVAFSNNEFRWSARIKRDDGLVRLVPGLGTRAVDRLSNDYPVLVSPGKPGIRVNASTEEILKYSPKNIDLINLETNSFETHSIDSLLKLYQDSFPGFEKIFSVYEHNFFTEKSGFSIDFERDVLIPTFNSLIKNTNFMQKINTILEILKEKLSTPVDIEFAVTGDDIYLLQCRPQSFSGDLEPQPIPQNIPNKDIIFTAHKYISNGFVPDISHIVYVDPEKYGNLETIEQMKRIGRAVGKLNLLLPKKKFILMGPGRWGSKGDIKLGVNVTYADINKTAVLIEIAKEKGNYVPDLSFGTHFFQDLVEAQIRYLPLYPDKEGNIFNENFFRFSNNILADILPEYLDLQDCIKVIDVSREFNGKVLKINMNADLEQAVCFLDEPEQNTINFAEPTEISDSAIENYWYWRLQVAEFLAQNISPQNSGVKNIYLIGSVKNANAGPASDIDLIIHFTGSKSQLNTLKSWLDGWSICLDYFNYLRTGYKTGGLLDVHFITDDDIRQKTSYAVKIGAVTDAARQLEMGK